MVERGVGIPMLERTSRITEMSPSRERTLLTIKARVFRYRLCDIDPGTLLSATTAYRTAITALASKLSPTPPR
jgi:hypothetical protein